MRWLAVIAFSVWTAAIIGAWRTQWAEPTDNYWVCRAYPMLSCDGDRVFFSTQRVLSVDGPHRYTIGRVDRPVVVHGPTQDLRPGATVSVGGLYDGGDVRERWHRVQVWHPWKAAVGVVGAAVGLLVLPWLFTVRRTGLARRPCPIS